MGMFMENEILYALTTLIRAAERLNNTVNPTAGPIECLHRMKLEAAIIIAKDTVEHVRRFEVVPRTTRINKGQKPLKPNPNRSRNLDIN